MTKRNNTEAALADLIGVSEVAEILGITVNMVYHRTRTTPDKLRDAGDAIPYVRRVNKIYLYSRKAIEAMVKEV